MCVRFISPSISCHILENHVIALFDWKCFTLLRILTCCCGIPPVQSWLTVKEAANKICQQSYLFFSPPANYFGFICICKPDLPKVLPFFRQNIILDFFAFANKICLQSNLFFFPPSKNYFEYKLVFCPQSHLFPWQQIILEFSCVTWLSCLHL